MVYALANAKPVGRQLIDVRCARWTDGCVAIIGDAAHAMAPHFGQGGGLAMADGWALGAWLSSPSHYANANELSEALRAWELRHRWLADTTQRYARFYTNVQSYVLRPLERPRAKLLRWLGNSGTAIKVNDGLLLQQAGI
ncbi:FAD-dependent monooxygenase [Mesorhizobium sp. CA8]|nr:FAD-dependent monooxygenase [Mesorhizobium sp. CA8]